MWEEGGWCRRSGNNEDCMVNWTATLVIGPAVWDQLTGYLVNL